MAAVQSGLVSVSGANVIVGPSPVATGVSWLVGQGVPDPGTVGNDGDFYIDSNNYAGFYGPKVQGYWGNLRQFVTGTGACNLQSKVNPTVANDSTQGYGVASLWMNTVTSTAYICTNATPGAAIWVQVVQVGTGPGTIAAGNDPRIVNATQKANNLSDLTAPSTALANLGGVPLYFVRNVNVSVTANFWDVVKANALTAPIVVTLPPSAPPSMQVVIKKVDTSLNTVTVQVPVGGALIDGLSSLVLSSAGAKVTLISDGTVWTAI